MTDEQTLVSVRDLSNRDTSEDSRRNVIPATETFIKDEQRWPVNVEKERQKKEAAANRVLENFSNLTTDDSGVGSSESEDESDNKQDEAKDKVNISQQEQRFLNDVKAEVYHLSHELQPNAGIGHSPYAGHDWYPETIDEDDTMTPDNWIPRSKELKRLTGKHPLNAEVDIHKLYEAGPITPTHLHYVRSHGAVPKLAWDTHRLRISSENGSLRAQVFKMAELTQMKSINIPVMITCTGNRRKELNMIKKSTGFNWTTGAIGCAFWRGVPLVDVLARCSVQQRPAETAWHIHFRGSDNLGEDYYETSLKYEYCIDPNNDVMLAYEMNDHKLQPDHGYPLRLIVPGYIGGRHVKWLSDIWISESPNTSHYHIWDNRMPPSFLETNKGPLAEAIYSHPDTACMEAVLQSTIVKPRHNEVIDLSSGISQDATYLLEGFAYNGNGGIVQRVEISLDNGLSWLYAFRRYPHKPLRNANKFWTWCFWKCEIAIVDLLKCEQIIVRCYGAGNNTQPEHPTWNLMGHQNNCWYRVKPDISKLPTQDGFVDKTGDSKVVLRFRHPVADDDSGWMSKQYDDQLIASESGKTYKKSEIEKHNSNSDCWIVVNSKVYDATSVLSWHPGGAGAIMPYAGAVAQETSNIYNSVHDEYANSKLAETLIGNLDKESAEKMEEESKAYEKERKSEASDERVFQKHRWIPAELVKRTEINSDVRLYTFKHHQKNGLGLGVGQHMQIGFHMTDKMVSRPYTMTRPAGADSEDGTFDLLVKTYFPTEKDPGGTVSNLLDCMHDGDTIEIKGPEGKILYQGNGKFTINTKEHSFKTINFVSGGTGMTPIWQTIKYMLECETEKVTIHFLDANQNEEEILLHAELKKLAEKHSNFDFIVILQCPSDEWKGERGLPDEKRMKRYLAGPEKDTVTLVCGPPPMLNAAREVMVDWGFEDGKNFFSY